MKKLVLATLLLSSICHADVIKCSFTEPFVNTAYDTAQSTLTYLDDQGKVLDVMKDVSFLIRAAGKFDLVGKDGKTIQSLNLNFQGSDGMSETVFPYDVKDNSAHLKANSGVGGCVSNILRAVQD